MRSQALTDLGDGPTRGIPRTSAVVVEELRTMVSHLTQGQPALGALLAIGFIVVLRDNALRLLPFVLGALLPLSMWQDRGFGHGALWERPVPRTRGNLIRHFTALTTVLALMAAVILAMFFADSMGVITSPVILVAGSMTGGAILSFTVMSIVGQLMNPRRRYLLPVGMVLLFPLFLLPTRFLIAITPSFARPVVIGPYGLGVFRGLWFGSGDVAPQWHFGDWLVSAAIWGGGCLVALIVVASAHQE